MFFTDKRQIGKKNLNCFLLPSIYRTLGGKIAILELNFIPFGFSFFATTECPLTDSLNIYTAKGNLMT